MRPALEQLLVFLIGPARPFQPVAQTGTVPDHRAELVGAELRRFVPRHLEQRDPSRIGRNHPRERRHQHLRLSRLRRPAERKPAIAPRGDHVRRLDHVGRHVPPERLPLVADAHAHVALRRLGRRDPLRRTQRRQRIDKRPPCRPVFRQRVEIALLNRHQISNCSGTSSSSSTARSRSCASSIRSAISRRMSSASRTTRST